MSNQRKQIILNEIAFWKQSKMLPEHYCDFLTTLYAEGEQQNEQLIGNAREAVKAKERRKGRVWIFIVPMIAVILVMLTFIIDSVLLVGIPAVVFAIVLIVLGIRILKKNELLGPILQLSAALIIFGVSLRVCLTFFEGNHIALYATLISNCVLWLVAGIGLRLMYFTIAGGLGLLAIILYGSFQ